MKKDTKVRFPTSFRVQNISQPATMIKAVAATVAANRGARLAIVTRWRSSMLAL
jgi:hypothetical protein